MTPFSARALVDRLVAVARKTSNPSDAGAVGDAVAGAARELVSELLGGGADFISDTLRLTVAALAGGQCSDAALRAAEDSFVAGLTRRIEADAVDECENRRFGVVSAVDRPRADTPPPPWSQIYAGHTVFDSLLSTIRADADAVVPTAFSPLAVHVADTLRVAAAHPVRALIGQLPEARKAGERFVCAFEIGSKDGTLVGWLLSRRSNASELEKILGLARESVREATKLHPDRATAPLGERLEACAPALLTVLRDKRTFLGRASPAEAMNVAAAERGFLAGRNFLRFRPDILALLDGATRGPDALVLSVTLLMHEGARMTLQPSEKLIATVAEASVLLGKDRRSSHV